jgi:hypothetical protein
LTTRATHADPEVRERAARKIEAWTTVFEGMLSGALQIGSRLPVVGTPAWATLEVVKGGFATGTLLAGGALQAHEDELLARLPAVPDSAERTALNAYYLGEEGFASLQRMLVDGCYRIRVPEEGALLVVAWLAQHGDAETAQALLDEIGPHFSRLRFYPLPHSQPLVANAVAHLQDVGTTIADLASVKPSVRYTQQKETIDFWIPLYGRVIELFLETIPGTHPTLQVGQDGKPLRSRSGKFHIEGGWPCQHYPQGWKERAQAVLKDYQQQRAMHVLCASPESAKAGFPTLRRYLERCVKAPKSLTGRDVGMIRSILAGLALKRGLPGSERWRAFREHQSRQVAGPTSADLARILADRLSGLPREQGLASLDEALAPVSEAEAQRFGVRVIKDIPEGLTVKVRRCLDAPVEVLVNQGIILSGEVLARVLPQITAQVSARGIDDPELRRLYGAIYAAFRRRRSLFLLNLQSQVKLEELPWIQAMADHRQDSSNTHQQARQVLEELVILAITAFPEQILPNKLLQEVRALVERAGLRMPIVDEVAADIFMGEFAEKFLRAAQKAADLLESTLYERYYGLSFSAIRQIDDLKPSWSGKTTSPEFARLCAELAGEGTPTGRWTVARNGKIIEQEQILTTHNLAVLFDALGLTRTLGSQLEDLAFRCFVWVCRRLQQRSGPWQAQLRMVKNAAYAWRQMIFFLSVGSVESLGSFLSRAEQYFQELPLDFRNRFQPAMTGLHRAANGLPVEVPASEDEVVSRRFLGWTTERHWLLA